MESLCLIIAVALNEIEGLPCASAELLLLDLLCKPFIPLQAASIPSSYSNSRGWHDIGIQEYLIFFYSKLVLTLSINNE